MSAPRLIHDFRPPEGVALRFEVASLGMRFGAQMIDILITGGALLALMIVLSVSEALPWSAVSVLWSILFLLIRAPYYILTELLWNGQTPGKRICRIRVISADGRSLRPYAVAVRNMMKEMEIFVPGTAILAAAGLNPLEYVVLLIWLAVLLAVPLMNRRRQRLGDMIAGTYVIHQPHPVLMPDLARAGGEGDYVFLAHHLDHYGAFELQTLERVLHVDTAGQGGRIAARHGQNLTAIAERIRTRIGYTDRVPAGEVPAFLRAFYSAQRRYLENRKLFGDARADKFHRDGAP